MCLRALSGHQFPELHPLPLLKFSLALPVGAGIRRQCKESETFLLSWYVGSNDLGIVSPINGISDGDFVG